MFSQKIGTKTDISGLVNTMNVSEASRNAEVGADLAKGIVDIPDVFRLSVQAVVVNSGVVDTIFFTTSDSDFHLKPKSDLRHTLKVLCASGNVLLFGFLRKIQHVGREQRLAVFLEVGFVRI